MDYYSFFAQRNIPCEKGLDDNELNDIERLYNIVFPVEYRAMLKEVVPVAEGFCDWRNMSDASIENIRERIYSPIKELLENTCDIYWNEEWGIEKVGEDRDCFLQEKLENAPKLIPVYAHRYMPMVKGKSVPVISIYGCDVIYYGSNINEYFEIEFGHRKQQDIEFANIRHIDFWTDIM